MNRVLKILLFVMLWILCSCEENVVVETGTAVTGTVKSVGQEGAIHPAFIILGDELLATTDKNGYYQITSLGQGQYELVCSALNFSDQIFVVDVEEDAISEQDFLLSPDENTGWIYGEFHDKSLYDENLVTKPSMAGWDGQQLFDGVSGATLQSKTFGFDLPERQVYLGDSLVCITDAFGQYWFEIQCGTYPLTAKCEGYLDTIQIVKVEPDGWVFANFILSEKYK